MSEEFKILTVDEQRRVIRRIWTSCIIVASSIFIGFGGIAAMLLSGDTDIGRVVGYTTIIFQVVIAMFATGFTTPYFLETRVNLNLGIDMNREALRLGRETAESLNKLQTEFVPVLKNLKTGIDDFVKILEKVKTGNGEVGEVVRKAVVEVRKTMKEGESQVEKWIWTKMDGFLANVFNGQTDKAPVEERGEDRMTELFGGRGHSDAIPPKGNHDVKNDEGLTAMEIIGRCSKCNAVGTLEYPKSMIPSMDLDKILAYKPIPGVRCLKCNVKCEFLPIEVKKYGEVPMLRTVQKQIKNGIPSIFEAGKGPKPGDGPKTSEGGIVLP